MSVSQQSRELLETVLKTYGISEDRKDVILRIVDLDGSTKPSVFQQPVIPPINLPEPEVELKGQVYPKVKDTPAIYAPQHIIDKIETKINEKSHPTEAKLPIVTPINLPATYGPSDAPLNIKDTPATPTIDKLPTGVTVENNTPVTVQLPTGNVTFKEGRTTGIKGDKYYVLTEVIKHIDKNNSKYTYSWGKVHISISSLHRITGILMTEVRDYCLKNGSTIIEINDRHKVTSICNAGKGTTLRELLGLKIILTQK